jgi:hypothetical protein
MVPEHNDERWLNDDQEGLTLEQLEQQNMADVQRHTHPDAALLKEGSGGTRPGSSGSSSRCKGGSKAKAGSSSLSSLSLQYGKSVGPRGVKLPLHLSANLVLLSLGRVEFLHPHFHNEKFIFPVGFAVKRRARTAAGGRELWHLAEILDQPDGSGPLFR